MKILRMIAGTTLIAVIAGTLSGCFVETRGPRHPHYWHHGYYGMVVR
ncbi:MAG TPA: hypothetical protein VLX92_03170 [Kofleriaceae bacterium]|nr:hypothetical protein [Kofleriaceae bacterium]